MKKYSEKFLNKHHILKTAIIGFEWEFYCDKLSYYKLLEYLNEYLSPIQVYGFKIYHPDFKPDKDKWIISPDLSGGSNLIEVISGPMPYDMAKFYFVKIMKFIQEMCYTNNRCSVHINISFDNNQTDKKLKDLNILKHILSTDEEEIYRVFPTREKNIYAKSVKKIIPYKEYDYSNVSIDVVKNSLRLPNDKYYGINMLHITGYDDSRLEYRYLGGKDYQFMVGDIMYFMDRFIITTWESIDGVFDDGDIASLEDYLQSNISNFKNLSKYDNFLTEYPQIELQIDQQTTYELINAMYPKLYSKLFQFLDGAENLGECVINYFSQYQKLEVVDATFKSVFTISNIDFIRCNIDGGIFEKCDIVDCMVNNVETKKCKLISGEIKSSKVFNTDVDTTDLKNCYFVGGVLNGVMDGGVFRGGEIGPNGILNSNVKVVNDRENFFDTKFDLDAGKKGVEDYKK
jgi:hypothetical protein